MSILFFLILLIPTLHAYEQSLTPWFCPKSAAVESSLESSHTLASCLPGFAIDVEDVVYESTTDGECSGRRLCSLHNKNTLTFACNQKTLCNLKIGHLRYHINSTCGSTVRFYIKYRCLPVIQEQKDYICDSSARRAGQSADINLSCENNYRLYIKMALVGISVRQQGESTRNRFQCNKDTYWLCNYYVPDAYRNICTNQLNRGYGSQCEIRFTDRPRLKGCPHGEASNFSLVEYLCIPSEGISEDLPRIDICSTEIPEILPIYRGLLHSPNYPHALGNYLSCKKRLQISRESRIRLFMLEKSLEYSHQFNIRLLNNEANIQRTLQKNELFETNITKDQQNENLEIELKTNHLGGGKFLLYFQVDSRISEYAPLALEADRKTDDYHRRRKPLVKRDWGIVIGSLIGLVLVLLLIAIVLIIIRICKRRRAQSLKYIKTDDDHRQHLNASVSSPEYPHYPPKKPIQIEHPHLLSSSPHSLTTNETLSDRESLLKQTHHGNVRNSTSENFYEEIKDQLSTYVQQTNLALGKTHPDTNLYLEPKSFEDRRKFFDEKNSNSPIRDHRENEVRYPRAAPLATPEQSNRRAERVFCDAPMASTETLDVGSSSINSEQMKRPNQVPPKIPPPRMDLYHLKPSAPPLHLLQQENNHDHTHHSQANQRWNNKN